jgi:hypothetical protein
MICLLSGCWASQGRLIDASSASTVDFEGQWQDAEAGARSRISITANGDGSYTLGDKDEKLQTYYLAMGDGWFVAQYEVDSDQLEVDQEVYMFQPVREDGDVLRLYSPPCDESATAISGVTSDGEACLIDSLEALKAVAADFIQRVDAGEIQAEDGVFVRPSETV